MKNQSIVSFRHNRIYVTNMNKAMNPFHILYYITSYGDVFWRKPVLLKYNYIIITEIPFFRFFFHYHHETVRFFHEIFHGYFSYWRHLSLQVYLYIMLNFVYNDIYTYIMLRDKLSYVAWVLNNGIMLDWKVEKIRLRMKLVKMVNNNILE